MKKSYLVFGFVFVLSFCSLGAIPPNFEIKITNTNEASHITPLANEAFDSLDIDVEVVNFDYDVNYCESCVPKETMDYFKKKIKFPLDVDNLEKGMVIVKFVYNENGSIEIIESNYTDERLKKYVFNKLEKHKLGKSIIEPNKFYFARFDFILQ